ncbi:hypothetical protein [Pseudoalteromonas sp. T1lg24]|uniref:hypothetical protein n=1 Tax=Pseudoalteromonas sp. T1lg24 TaxID=2077099 RepID=UPI000CF60D21|nr:hypothetical protein [Pseudoalteromonas sp. T1lg24]
MCKFTGRFEFRTLHRNCDDLTYILWTKFTWSNTLKYLNKNLQYFTIILSIICLEVIAEPSSYNSGFCHSCDATSTQYRAYELAANVGFFDPINELERPTRVYVFNWNKKSVEGFDVWNKIDLFTGKPFTVFPIDSTPSIQNDWINFVSDWEDFFYDPYRPPYNGFDYLTDLNVKNQVHAYIRNTYIQYMFASARLLDVLDGKINWLPQDSINSITLTFQDNVQIVLELENISQIGINRITDLRLKYLMDSAYIVQPDGYKDKIPDDFREATQGFMLRTNANSEGFENYMSNRYGFGGDVGSFGHSGLNITCHITSTVVTNEDGRERRVNTYRCVKY